MPHAIPQTHSVFYLHRWLWRQDGLVFAPWSRKHEFEKVFERKTRQVYFIYPFPRWLKLGKSLIYKRAVSIFSLEMTFLGRKNLFCKTGTDLTHARLRDWQENSRQLCITLDFVSGLHNCFEFSHPLECLYQAMQTRKTFSKYLIRYLKGTYNIRNLTKP